MPKKPGSARRRKTTVSMGNGDNIEIDAEVLSESHTIIDDSVFSGDFDGFDEFDVKAWKILLMSHHQTQPQKQPMHQFVNQNYLIVSALHPQ